MMKEAGFTLIEVMVAFLVLVVVFSGANTLYSRGVDNYSSISEKASFRQGARYSFFKIVGKLRDYEVENIYLLKDGKELLLGEDGDIDYHVQLLKYEKEGTIYINSSPVASNIKKLVFTPKEICIDNEKCYLNAVSPEDFDLLKVELIAGREGVYYKLKTLVSPKSDF